MIARPEITHMAVGTSTTSPSTSWPVIVAESMAEEFGPDPDVLEAIASELRRRAAALARTQLAPFARDLVVDGCPDCNGKVSVAGHSSVGCRGSDGTGCGWRFQGSELRRRALASCVQAAWADRKG